MKKLGFVTPWYGEKIPGGAEMELRGLVHHLRESGVELEVLTTCVKDFYTDWTRNYHNPGVTEEAGITVRRFAVKKIDMGEFGTINYKLMNQMRISPKEEKTYITQSVNSQDLYNYIKEHESEYHAFIFIPYMFGTTYHGCLVCPEKAILIPCLHDESYAYMGVYKEAFSRIKGIIYHAQPEYDLANRIYDLSKVNQAVLGEGLDTDIAGDAVRFRKQFEIEEPFILYAGRKDSGKNVDTLVRYFEAYKKRNQNRLKLILIGGGSIEIPSSIKEGVIDLGYVDTQDKYDACAAAELLCQPSLNESFSLVIMESWLCGRPVLVHEACNVTSYFAKTARGGLYFKNYLDFEGCVNYILTNREIAERMGRNGGQFVRDNFSWDVIVRKYMDFFEA